jgi:ABC-type antimicrobial peptide transport system permease subunit
MSVVAPRPRFFGRLIAKSLKGILIGAGIGVFVAIFVIPAFYFWGGAMWRAEERLSWTLRGRAADGYEYVFDVVVPSASLGLLTGLIRALASGRREDEPAEHAA